MLFKSFTQIDGSYTREYGGTGLGLVITRQLLEMMGGSVTFSSQLGVGSTFTIFIPMLFTKKSGETAVDSGEEISFIGSWVLLVEDDRVNQIVIAKMLESLGATVDVAANGAEGVQAAAQKVYDVILMDVQMPVMDGIQATRMIRGWTQSSAPTVNVKVSGLNQKTPIIALTAFALKGDEAIFKASGMDGYLSKPLDRYQMQMLLKEYLGNHENTEVTQMEALISSFYEKDQDLMRSGLTAENTIDEQQKVTVNQKIESLNQLLDQGNLMLMEVIAHQLKGVFEQMNAVELKNLVFKMELEIRKDRVEKVAGYLKRITEIWLLMKADNEWEN